LLYLVLSKRRYDINEKAIHIGYNIPITAVPVK
jgi:hypothetical protein